MHITGSPDITLSTAQAVLCSGGWLTSMDTQICVPSALLFGDGARQTYSTSISRQSVPRSICHGCHTLAHQSPVFQLLRPIHVTNKAMLLATMRCLMMKSALLIPDHCASCAISRADIGKAQVKGAGFSGACREVKSLASDCPSMSIYG